MEDRVEGSRGVTEREDADYLCAGGKACTYMGKEGEHYEGRKG